MLNWLKSNVTGLSIIGAVITFIWPVLQFILTRRHDLQFREFGTYHRLVKELVGGDKIDHQAAVVFELRHFPRYFECTQRILLGLRETWGGNEKWSRLIQEIDLTLAYIKKKI